jgi:hypothetical protein
MADDVIQEDHEDPDWLPTFAAHLDDHDVIVLPESLADDRGEYPGEVDGLVKIFRSQGLDAAFLHEAEQRYWRARHGETEVAFALAIAASIIGSASWDAFKVALGAWIGPMRTRPLRLRLRVRNGNIRRLTLRGDSQAVLDALDRLPKVIRTDE